MKRTDLTILQRFWLETLWLGARVFAVMPYWFKYYVVENLLFVLLYYCLRYRMKVVKTNLRNSFPEKSERELAVIRRRFYRTLSEIFVDTINMAYMNEEKGRTVLTVKDVEKHVEAVHGRDWIAMTAHFGCWEYDSFLALYTGEHYLAAVYHPLENKVIDAVYMRLRRRRNIRLIPMKEIIRYYIDHRLPAGAPGQRIGIGLIADQNPPLRPNSHWFRFLNQDTVFFDGIEKMALKFHMPVYFCRQRRLRRGYYELEFLRLYDGVEQVAPNEVTERYVRQLESDIVADPGMWLWSHRRWKHRRPQCPS